MPTGFYDQGVRDVSLGQGTSQHICERHHVVLVADVYQDAWSLLLRRSINPVIEAFDVLGKDAAAEDTRAPKLLGGLKSHTSGEVTAGGRTPYPTVPGMR